MSAGRRRESTLEKYITDFVFHHVREKVDLHLHDAISVRPISRKGSILLGVFWANVLQCTDNYPPSVCRYRKSVDVETGEEKLIGCLSGEVTAEVYLTSGLFRVRGKYIYEWVVQKFRKLLDNFDPKFAESWVYIPIAAVTLPEDEQRTRTNEHYTELERYLLYQNTVHSTDINLHRKLLEGDEDWIEKSGNLNIDSEIWTEIELPSKLKIVQHINGLQDGFSFIHKLMLSLLNKWFSDAENKVYLCSPKLDCAILSDIISTFLRHPNTGNISGFYTPIGCDNSKDITAIKHEALMKYPQASHNAIVYNVLRKIAHPCTRLHASFVAAVKGEAAEVLTTSAAFHSEHMKTRCLENVTYALMSPSDFRERFLQLVSEPNAATEY